MKDTIQMRTERQLKRSSTLKCSICNTAYTGVFLPHEVYGYDKGYWKDLPICDCEKKLREKTEEKNRLKSKGEKIKVLIIKARDVGLGKRYENKTFSNFDKDRNIEAYLACMDYTKNFSDNLKSGKRLIHNRKSWSRKNLSCSCNCR